LIRQSIANEAPDAWANGVKLSLKPLRLSNVIAMCDLAFSERDA
jgi:hypothetical protein